MKKKYLLLAVSMLVLAGCATPAHQAQPALFKDVSQQEVQQDNAYCMMQAQQINTADYAYRGTFMEGANIKMKQHEQMRLCLLSKGYH